MNHLDSEIEYFERIEPSLIHKGWLGRFVVIHNHEILADGETVDDAISKLRARYRGEKPPKPLLVREIEGPEKNPVRMRSPRVLPSKR